MLDFVFDLLTCKRRRQAFPPTEDLYQIKRRKPNIVVTPSLLDRSAQVATGRMWAARGKLEQTLGLGDVKDPEELYKRLISEEDEQSVETLRVKIKRLGEVVKLGEESLRRFKRDKETETSSRTFVAIEESDFVLPPYVLSPEETQEVEGMWEHPDDAFVIATLDNIPLSVKDVKTLRGRSWLNDEVINSYGFLLSKSNPQTLIHNTYFLPLLSQRTAEGRINLQKIDRIHKRKNVRTM